MKDPYNSAFERHGISRVHLLFFHMYEGQGALHLCIDRVIKRFLYLPMAHVYMYVHVGTETFDFPECGNTSSKRTEGRGNAGWFISIIYKYFISFVACAKNIFYVYSSYFISFHLFSLYKSKSCSFYLDIAQELVIQILFFVKSLQMS